MGITSDENFLHSWFSPLWVLPWALCTASPVHIRTNTMLRQLDLINITLFLEHSVHFFFNTTVLVHSIWTQGKNLSVMLQGSYLYASRVLWFLWHIYTVAGILISEFNITTEQKVSCFMSVLKWKIYFLLVVKQYFFCHSFILYHYFWVQLIIFKEKIR